MIRRGFKSLGIALKILGISIIGLNCFNIITINLKTKHFKFDVVAQNLEGAEDFSFNENNELIISTENSLIKIDVDKSKKELFYDKNLKLGNLVYKGNEIFYLGDSKLNSYNLDSNIHKVLIDNIPNYGDYSDCKLFLDGDNIFITIGAATNSGIVGADNNWKSNKKSDIPSYDLSLSGINYGDPQTGAFMPEGVTTSDGQDLKEGYIGNASVLKYDISNNTFITVAHGVRNIEGIDSDSSGNIFFTVGGLEARGERPIYGDSDYVYKFEEEGFYGWPDYSGGDPVNSAKFKHEKYKTQEKVINNTLDTPIAPIYEHTDVTSLGTVAIDKFGDLKSVDSFFIYDKSNGDIFNLNINGQKELFFNTKSSDIEKLLFNDKELYTLDAECGVLYSIAQNNKSIFIYLFIILGLIAGFYGFNIIFLMKKVSLRKRY